MPIYLGTKIGILLMLLPISSTMKLLKMWYERWKYAAPNSGRLEAAQATKSFYEMCLQRSPSGLRNPSRLVMLQYNMILAMLHYLGRPFDSYCR